MYITILGDKYTYRDTRRAVVTNVPNGDPSLAVGFNEVPFFSCITLFQD